MRALVHHGPGQRSWEQVPDPELRQAYGVFAAPEETGALKVLLERVADRTGARP